MPIIQRERDDQTFKRIELNQVWIKSLFLRPLYIYMTALPIKKKYIYMTALSNSRSYSFLEFLDLLNFEL